MASILIVEDDQRIREALANALADRGHSVRSCGKALDSLPMVIDWDPDAVVLDLGLPDLDGRQLLGMIRSVSDVPVVVATARDDEAETIRLLDAGADDYVVKPFAAAHLEARLRAVLRRNASGAAPAAIEVGPLRIDLASREATLDGELLDLTRKEFDLLATLAQRPGQVVSKRTLLAEVWRQPAGGSDKTIDVHLTWLRRKLGESAAEPRLLHSVRGVGVKLVAPR